MPEGQYVTSWSQFQALPGAVEAIALLNAAGIRVIVVSNQRGVARGLYTAADVNAIHAELQELLAEHGARIDAFYFCPHDKGKCNCRKPLPGMFEQAVAEFPSITPATSVMIGDAKSDMEFGRRLGMRTYLIEGNPDRQKPGMELARDLSGLRFSSLYEAVTELLGRFAPHPSPTGASCLGFPGKED